MSKPLTLTTVLIVSIAASRAARADNCPEPVRNLTATMCASPTSITVSWTAAPNANEYAIYRESQPFLPANPTAFATASTTSFVDEDPGSDFFYYWVQSRPFTWNCPSTLVGPVVGLIDHGPMAQPDATFTNTCSGVEVRSPVLPDLPMVAFEVLAGPTPNPANATVVFNSLQTNNGGGVTPDGVSYLVPALPGAARYCWARVVAPCRASPVTPTHGVLVPPLITYPITAPVVTASQEHCDEIVLTWPAVRNSIRYDVERMVGTTVEAAWSVLDPPFIDAAPVTPEMGTTGRLATYRVTAVNACGDRAVSQEVTGRQPAGFFIEPRSGMTVAVGDVALLSGFNYGLTNLRWTRNGQPVTPSGRVTVLGPTLVISPVTQADAGTYVVSADRTCTSALPGPIATVYLAVTTPCPADFNGSGELSVQDIFDFLAAYFAGCV